MSAKIIITGGGGYIGSHAAKFFLKKGHAVVILDNYSTGYKGAIEAFTLAIELNPKLGLAYNNRGISRSILGDDQGAIEDFTKAIEIQEDYMPAYLNRAASRYNLQDYYGAIEDYTIVIEKDPENALAWYGRGISHIQISYFVGACNDLQRASELGYDVTELIREHCR